MSENEPTETEPTVMASPGWEEREARIAQADKEAMRIETMHMAVQWCASPNWSGDVGHVIGIAAVFEEYIRTGQRPTSDEITQTLRVNR